MFYNRAKFQNNLRGCVENTCWIDMEWPSSTHFIGVNQHRLAPVVPLDVLIRRRRGDAQNTEIQANQNSHHRPKPVVFNLPLSTTHLSLNRCGRDPQQQWQSHIAAYNSRKKPLTTVLAQF